MGAARICAKPSPDIGAYLTDPDFNFSFPGQPRFYAQ